MLDYQPTFNCRQVTPESRFVDLGADSLDTVEILMVGGQGIGCLGYDFAVLRMVGGVAGARNPSSEYHFQERMQGYGAWRNSAGMVGSIHGVMFRSMMPSMAR